MTRIKICGITRRADAEAAVELGADFLGFNFYPKSPRFITPALARSILAGLPRAVGSVGVFVNESPPRIQEVCGAAGIGLAQLHGEESAETCALLDLPVIKAVRLGSADDLSGIERYHTWALLVDSKTKAFGGSGARPDWELAAKVQGRCRRMFLAGGLGPDNVAEAIKAVNPWAVDVASGVELEPGIKDHEKIRRFIGAVKKTQG